MGAGAREIGCAEPGDGDFGGGVRSDGGTDAVSVPKPGEGEVGEEEGAEAERNCRCRMWRWRICRRRSMCPPRMILFEIRMVGMGVES